MKKFLLLFLLGCWSHVGAKDLRCNTGVIYTGHSVSVHSSQLAGAHVLLLRAYTSPKLYDCLEDCCFAKYGICSIAEFHNATKESNCLHYSCQPLHNCKFMNARAKDSFTFPGLSKSYEPQESVMLEPKKDHLITDQTPQNGDSYIHRSGEPKEHTRAVSARKGVEISTPFAEGEILPEPTRAIEHAINLHKSAFKNDNTSIKPRKGVDSISEKEASGIKPRKGVDLVHHTQDKKSFDSGKSKVKPRKGVEFFTSSSNDTPSKSSSVHVELPIKSYSSSLFENTSQSEFMPMLEQILQDDPTYLNSSMKSSSYSQNSTYSFSISSQVTTVSPTSVSVTSVSVTSVPLARGGISEPSIMSSLQETGTEPSIRLTAFSTHSLFSSKVEIDQLNAVQSTPPIDVISVTSVEMFSAQSSKARQEELESSSVSEPQDSTQSPVDLLPIRTTSKMITPFVANSSNSTRFVLTQSMIVEAENERKYKSSMHLVLSLVFGLMVLLVVLGAVAKRVYDVWMRRHYHRMDFLIDGMYDGYS